MMMDLKLVNMNVISKHNLCTYVEKILAIRIYLCMHTYIHTYIRTYMHIIMYIHA